MTHDWERRRSRLSGRCPPSPLCGYGETPSTVGPPRGTVVLASAQTPAILTRFIEVAGGADSPIVLIPTAALNKPGGDRIVLTPSNPPETALKAQGAKNVTMIHTFDRTVADTEALVKPITRATGKQFEEVETPRRFELTIHTKKAPGFHRGLRSVRETDPIC